MCFRMAGFAVVELVPASILHPRLYTLKSWARESPNRCLIFRFPISSLPFFILLSRFRQRNGYDDTLQIPRICILGL